MEKDRGAATKSSIVAGWMNRPFGTSGTLLVDVKGCPAGLYTFSVGQMRVECTSTFSYSHTSM